MTKRLFLFLMVGLFSGVGAWWYVRSQTVTGPSYRDIVVTANQQIAAAEPAPITRSAWIAWWNDDQALVSLQKHPDSLTTLMPVWYQLDGQGKVVVISSAKQKNAIAEFALAHHLSLLPTITNEFDPERVSQLLDNDTIRDQVIDSLVFTAISSGYSGWDLDWEEMYPGDRPGFTAFVTDLAQRLHEKNLLLSVTVQAKNGLEKPNSTTQAQDWDALGQSADTIRLMLYDYHSEDSDPGPVTPLADYQTALSYALSHLPKEKISVGLPTYGYDWKKGGQGEPVQFTEIVDRLQRQQVSGTRDEQSAALSATYKENAVRHEVWYEDAESTRVKIMIARARGISSFSFWRLGGEDDRLWEIK